MAGNFALQSPYGEYGSGTQRPAYLAYGTSSRRFFCYYAKLLLLISFGRVKDKLRLGGKINWGLAKTFGSLSEGAPAKPVEEG